MSLSRQTPSRDADEPERVFAVYSRITAQCVFAGLQAWEAEDVAQDVWEWLIRSGNVAAAGVVPWLAAVTKNFVRRFRRRRMRETVFLQELALRRSERGDMLSRQLEAKQFLDRLETLAQGSERRLLELLRQDWRLSEASERLRIPKGSEQFRLRNLRKEAKQIGHPTSTRRTLSPKY